MGVQDRSVLGLVIETQTVGQAEIDKLSVSFNNFASSLEKQSKRISDQNKSVGDSFKKMQAESAESLEKFKSTLESPFAAATSAAKNFVLGLGPVGLAIAGIATAATLGATELHKLTLEKGEAAEAAVNFAERLGIAVGEGKQLSAMARIAGVDIGFLENASARLASSLEDQGAKGDKARAALQKLNVATIAQNGDQRELGQITLDAVKALGNIENTTERTALGVALLGRGFNEITPLIKKFKELEDVVRSLGIGINNSGTLKLAEFNEQVKIADLQWEKLKTSLAAKIAPIEIQFIGTLAGAFDSDNKNPSAAEFAVRALMHAGKSILPGGNLNDLNQDSAQFFNPGPPPLPPAPPIPAVVDPDAERGKALAEQYKRRFAANQDADQLRKQLTKLQADRDDIQSALTNPASGGAAKDAKAKELSQNDREITQLQAQIKLLDQRKTLEEDIAKVREDVSTTDLAKQLGIDPDHAVPSQQKLLDLLSRRGITPSQSDQVKALLAPKIDAEQQKKIDGLFQTLDTTRVSAEEQRAQRSGAAAIRNIEASVNPGDSEQALRAAQRVADIRIQSAQRTFDLEQERIDLETASLPNSERALQTEIQLTKARGDLEKETQDAQLDREQKIADIQRQRLERQRQEARDIAVAGIVNQEQGAQSSGEREIQRIQLTARPGEEVGTANQALQIRLRTAQQVNDLERQISDTQIAAMKADDQAGAKKLANIKLEGDLQKAQQDAQVEFQNQILQIQQQQQNQARDAAGRTFDAITASGKDAFAQLGQSFLKTFERQVFVNATSVIFDQARKAASGAIPGQVDKNGNLTTTGKLLQGTFLGVDPLKIATTLNTTSTNQNTAALNKLTVALGGTATGGNVQLLDRPLLRTPGFSPEDDLKDSSAVKAAKDNEADVQKEGTAAIKSLTNKLVGIGGTAAIGAVGAIGGIQQGGVQGAVSAAGSVASATGAILGQLSGALGKYGGLIGSVAGIGLGLVSQFLPNAKATFDSEQDATIKKNAYVAPAAQSQNVDATGGGNLGTNLRGAPNVTVQFNVSTIDTKGVKSFFDAHGATIAEVVGKATQGGQSPNMTLAINKTAFPGA